MRNIEMEELTKYLPSDIAKIIVKMTQCTCSVCGNANGFQDWENAPCSKECLKKILAINNDSEFSLFPAEWLSDF